MNSFSNTDMLNRAKELFVESGRLSTSEIDKAFKELEPKNIQADGSSRRFWRLQHRGKSLGLIIAPEGSTPNELAESRSVWKIGSHLYNKGVPVPELYGWDRPTGLLLCEDLGDTRLQDYRLSEPENSGKSSHEYYEETVKQLATMQINGAAELDRDWCWDYPFYDASVMLERESGYFLRAFWQDLLGYDVANGVVEECKELAKKTAEAPSDFFLHRDFQSRNIMITDGKVRFIDFQAGRFGPLGYDIASLLIDPYVALPEEKQEQLLAIYIAHSNHLLPLNDVEFRTQFSLLALHRNLQIIGAFAFLSKVKKKKFFSGYIKPALQTLELRLEETLYKEYSQIRSMVKYAVRDLKQA